VLQSLPATSQTLLLSKTFFPNLISAPFDDGWHIAFTVSVILVLIAALASLLRGKRYIYEQEARPQPDLLDPVMLTAPVVEKRFTKK
jgi:hypothetical protein